MWTIQLSGTKAQAKLSLAAQVPDEELRRWFEQLIDSSPGTHIAMSGSLSGTRDQGFGTLSLSGSFWTIK